MREPLYTDEQHEREHLRFTVTRDGDRCAVEVFARLNALNGPPLRDRLRFEVDEGAKWITIDLAGVDEIDRDVLGSLYSVAIFAAKKGGAITIRDAKPHVIVGFQKWKVSHAFTFAVSNAEVAHG